MPPKKDRRRSFLKFFKFSEDCSTCVYIRKYLLVFAGIFTALFFILGYNLMSTGKLYAHYVNLQMSHNIYEYNEVDLEQLCRISVCKYVYKINKTTIGVERHYYYESKFGTENLWIVRKLNEKPVLRHLYENYFIDELFNAVLYNEKADAYFALKLDKFYSEMKYTYLYTFLSVFAFMFILLLLLYRKQQREALLQTYGTEAILSNQSMILITENIHHEMNTPLEVIDNKLEKIKRTINDYILEEFHEFENTPGAILTPERIKINNRMIRLNKDFDFVHTALEQVFGILERMKGFKHLKYSNGNKTIYDIATGACQVISIRNTGFDFDIDDNLKNFKLKHETTKDLKNVDLLNILINHLKNSLEAKSSEIHVTASDYNKGMLKLLLVDNGNGIPEHFIDDVIKPNFSTKATKGAVRGNGMYLNKYILNSAGGDVEILDSNENGTIVEINIPCLKIEAENAF